MSRVEVHCVGDSGADLKVSPSRYFHTDRTIFNVTIGSIYPVFGLGVWETVFLVLVTDDTGTPNWLPIALFDLNSFRLPKDWDFAVLDVHAASGGDASNRWVVMWGYPELVNDRGHSDALIERRPEALEIFYGYSGREGMSEA